MFPVCPINLIINLFPVSVPSNTRQLRQRGRTVSALQFQSGGPEFNPLPNQPRSQGSLLSVGEKPGNEVAP